MSSEFSRTFFTLATGVVFSIIWFGYYRNIFVPWLAKTTLFSLVGYMTVFLTYRYLTEHIAQEASEESYYVFIAAFHGTMSLWAIAQTSYLLYQATKAYTAGENYFRTHPYLCLTLMLAWVLALGSGMFL